MCVCVSKISISPSVLYYSVCPEWAMLVMELKQCQIILEMCMLADNSLLNPISTSWKPYALLGYFLSFSEPQNPNLEKEKLYLVR